MQVTSLADHAARRAASAHFERIASRAAAVAGTAADLRTQFAAAFLADPQRLLPTPGFADSVGGRAETSVADIVADDFAGRDGDAVLHELLRIVADAARGENVELRATLWISVQAEKYAAFHAEDAA